jgi:glycosyltransferase involved in cell wall biosynthesis
MIIPVHNGLDQLARCIESVRKHTPRPYEWIVVDRGSDASISAFCREQEIPFVSFSYKVDYAMACNAGLRIATGSYLAVLHPEVIVYPLWLTNMLKDLQRDEQVGAVSPKRIEDRSIDREAKDRIVPACFLFKREVLHRIGELEGDSPEQVAEDASNRIRQCGFVLQLCDTAYVHYNPSDIERVEEG